ncbi:outer membrane protein assembly factor BamB family protein [Peredibacter starrii]|uniref:PQQ-binding-like beta-propeller repeat protein n=1 Tax=Peredibacter starrii TaxID=28202 RepID=A0AAX4HKM4_9BACT|nr:PQQ-binding-like beta-propeller repeat protein [Peredibacter starrii]WPU63784.1 PQQ-binding-like beta-propeller repeat protein [Peredibacter starrii]
MKYLALLILLAACGSFKPHAPEKQTRVFNVSWSKNLDSEYVSGNLAIGLGAPRIFNDIVYMGSLDGVMTAYDLESGRVLWQHNEKTPLGGPVEFFKDHVAYGGLSGRLFVRHYLTGQLKYAIDLGAPVESAPLYFNDRMIVYLRGHQIVHMDAETGKILWVYKRAVPVTTTLQRTTKPLVLGNKIIVGFADGFVGALSLEEGLLLWETKLVEQSKFIDVDLNPLLVGGVVVTGSPSGELKAVNPDSGALFRSYGVSVAAHPLLKGEQLVLGTNDGEVILMSVGGEILKRVKVSKQPVSAVGWWKDTIIAASFDGYLRAIDPLTLKIVDEFAMGYDYSAVFSDLVINEEYMAIYSSRNRLYLFH